MAGFDLSSFIAQNDDFARGYTFYIEVHGGFVNIEDTKYLVKSSVLPASTMGIAEANWQGNVYKLGTTQEFAELTVSFNVDPSDTIRTDFFNWMTTIHDMGNNHHGAPSEYMQDVVLDHVSHRDGSPIMTYTLIKAFPSNVSEMSLDYGAKDLATFDVTFTYQFHQLGRG